MSKPQLLALGEQFLAWQGCFPHTSAQVQGLILLWVVSIPSGAPPYILGHPWIQVQAGWGQQAWSEMPLDLGETLDGILGHRSLKCSPGLKPVHKLMLTHDDVRWKERVKCWEASIAIRKSPLCLTNLLIRNWGLLGVYLYSSFHWSHLFPSCFAKTWNCDGLKIFTENPVLHLR